jgi:hypothetical protein
MAKSVRSIFCYVRNPTRGSGVGTRRAGTRICMQRVLGVAVPPDLAATPGPFSLTRPSRSARTAPEATDGMSRPLV